ncbi:hypothetical protein EE612_005394 [Oryza sativa]|nr:hypothetical protein EE612_005394 [Oryza sativa]
MAGIVVVFDFDKTIIDVDSDNWVVDGLGATEEFERLLPTMPWNTLMDTMMGELHARGKSLADVAGVLRSAPLDPRVVAAIKACYGLGCDLRILSDANRFFIDTILDHHGLTGYFSEINTNPSAVDAATGRIRIAPYHDFHAGPHGCGLGICPPNMCKGQVLDRIRASAGAAGKRVIYLGDGRGDYCPSLRLGRDDFMMPRRASPCGSSSARTRRCSSGGAPVGRRRRDGGDAAAAGRQGAPRGEEPAAARLQARVVAGRRRAGRHAHDAPDQELINGGDERTHDFERETASSNNVCVRIAIRV